MTRRPPRSNRSRAAVRGGGGSSATAQRQQVALPLSLVLFWVAAVVVAAFRPSSPPSSSQLPFLRRVVGRRQRQPQRQLVSPTAVVVTVALNGKTKKKSDDDDDLDGDDDDVDATTFAIDPIVAKASWYAVEAFGKAFGSDGNKNEEQKSPSPSSPSSSSSRGSRPPGAAEISLDRPPSSVEETLARIRADNDREYFLSGRVDELVYDERCVFADPFVSFTGRKRFVDNLANLGSFVTEYSAKPLRYDGFDDGVEGVVVSGFDGRNVVAVETKFMVKLRLNLPWKPVLAWPWGCVAVRAVCAVCAVCRAISVSLSLSLSFCPRSSFYRVYRVQNSRRRFVACARARVLLPRFPGTFASNETYVPSFGFFCLFYIVVVVVVVVVS